MNREKNGFMIYPIRLEFSNGLYHVMPRETVEKLFLLRMRIDDSVS
jgi:hypothetical protein